MEWRPLTPADAAGLMRGYGRRWWVGGGWAIDLFLGRTTPPHDDVDVVVLRDEQQLVHGFRRDPRITLELDRVGLVRDGIPYLAPEIPLLYKSKEPRERDEADLAAVLGELPEARRVWLAGALRLHDPAHPWLLRLE